MSQFCEILLEIKNTKALPENMQTLHISELYLPRQKHSVSFKKIFLHIFGRETRINKLRNNIEEYLNC